MKTVTVLLFSIYSIMSFAQDYKGVIPYKKDVLIYDTVFVFKNIDSVEIYNSTKKFIAQEFKTKECYIDLSGKAISCKGHSYINTEYQNIKINELCTFDFSVYIKKDKCRVVIKDVNISSSVNGEMSTNLDAYLSNLQKIPFTGRKMAYKIGLNFNDEILRLLSRYTNCVANPENDDMFNF